MFCTEGFLMRLQCETGGDDAFNFIFTPLKREKGALEVGQKMQKVSRVQEFVCIFTFPTLDVWWIQSNGCMKQKNSDINPKDQMFQDNCGWEMYWSTTFEVLFTLCPVKGCRNCYPKHHLCSTSPNELHTDRTRNNVNRDAAASSDCSTRRVKSDVTWPLWTNNRWPLTCSVRFIFFQLTKSFEHKPVRRISVSRVLMKILKRSTLHKPA